MRFRHFLRQSFIGGILVLAPVTILFLLFRWAFNTTSELIQPFTDFFMARIGSPEWLIDIMVIGLIILLCFAIGTLVSTGAGRWLHNRFDRHLTRLAPGYQLVKEIIHQLLGDSEDSPFKKGEVVRAYLFGREFPTSVTAIVTSRHGEDNRELTLFVPTGPNPTSGMIYHLHESQVDLLDHTSVEAALKTVLACGAGSGPLLHPPRQSGA